MEARVYWEKAENAFMYRIYRTYTDGHKEFVGATPSDAFYLGSFDKDGSETACTFEITSYSENGVKGGTQTFSIAWPAEVENGFVPIHDDGPNLALKCPCCGQFGSLPMTALFTCWWMASLPTASGAWNRPAAGRSLTWAKIRPSSVGRSGMPTVPEQARARI